MNFLGLVSMAEDKGIGFKDKQLAFKCQAHYLLACISWINYSTLISSSKDGDSTTYITGFI